MSNNYSSTLNNEQQTTAYPVKVLRINDSRIRADRLLAVPNAEADKFIAQHCEYNKKTVNHSIICAGLGLLAGGLGGGLKYGAKSPWTYILSMIGAFFGIIGHRIYEKNFSGKPVQMKTNQFIDKYLHGVVDENVSELDQVLLNKTSLSPVVIGLKKANGKRDVQCINYFKTPPIKTSLEVTDEVVEKYGVVQEKKAKTRFLYVGVPAGTALAGAALSTIKRKGLLGKSLLGACLGFIGGIGIDFGLDKVNKDPYKHIANNHFVLLQILNAGDKNSQVINAQSTVETATSGAKNDIATQIDTTTPELQNEISEKETVSKSYA